MNPFARQVLDWYDEDGRHDLPWQCAATPYSIWVSEIMLQQTQVATVIPYFERFLERFPDIASLAQSCRDEVLAHWSGLGYYARGRNLHDAAAIVVRQHDGKLPQTLDELTALPGIGRSTAGAILSLGFGQRAVILDGNVKRVLARYFAVAGWPGRTAVARELWDLAEQLTPHERVDDYTQAIMDLGATLCRRGDPDCERCPVRQRCAARIAGTQSEYPHKKPRAKRRQRHVAVLLVRDSQRRVLLQRRPDAGIWGGLYSLPELADATEATSWCADRFGADVTRRRSLEPIDHSFTHFDLRMEPLMLELGGAAESAMDSSDWLWYKPREPLDVGIAAPIAALLDTLN